MKYTMKDFINKQIAVKLKNKKEVKKFLEMCEEEGLRWQFVDKASQFLPSNKIQIAYRFFDNYLSWHTFTGSVFERNEWKVVDFKDFIKETQSIHIYTDGKTTTAILKEGKKVFKKAQSECNEQDEFDFKTGAKLAFDRLFDEDIKNDDKKLFNGKAICVECANPFLTKWKIYKFKNGRSINDKENKFPYSRAIIDIDDLNNVMLSQFIEVVE